ncbi:hypothetical protein HC761_02400 [bacterium]|nr:hypothetical protein [bacterium]
MRTYQVWAYKGSFLNPVHSALFKDLLVISEHKIRAFAVLVFAKFTGMNLRFRGAVESSAWAKRSTQQATV